MEAALFSHPIFMTDRIFFPLLKERTNSSLVPCVLVALAALSAMVVFVIKVASISVTWEKGLEGRVSQSLQDILNEGKPIQEVMKAFLEFDGEIDQVVFREALLEKFPPLAIFLKKIKELQLQPSDQRPIGELSDLINGLYVLFGIKPVLVLTQASEETQKTRIEALTQLAEQLPHIHVKRQNIHGGYVYLVNEAPLDYFNPRRFLQEQAFPKDKSLADGVMHAFPNQNETDTDQLLAYFLGFGPTWEAFYGKGHIRRENALPFPEERIFAHAHYEQLGSAFCKYYPQNKNLFSETSFAQIGEEFSKNPIKYHQYSLDALKGDNVSNELHNLYMEQVVDPLSYETEYIQKGITYRKKLLVLLDISFKKNPSDQ